MPNEEYAIVLDYLPRGKSSSFKTEQLAQLLGTEFFSLLEVVPKKELKIGSKVYIGPEVRDEIALIKRRIPYKELTPTAAGELGQNVEKIVMENEKKFVDFYNHSIPITIRRHQLELLPGVGPKHVKTLLDERQRKPFESFKELSDRVPALPNPSRAIVKRVMQELEFDDEKHYVFCRPPPKEKPRFERSFERGPGRERQ
ncbi:MAG: DUF655 domain-containing protein [Candidatus Diapherotrites archaeon]|uniref:DUF655 domain-containing protein n=1 Tax=Candidatus Iainarchaeum sp. TaxID=3101447 RepID=A0A8T4L455_9ARCH|nr:DUF655 domain-containing protein [Candidatus Diapherotrites archaeon]